MSHKLLALDLSQPDPEPAPGEMPFLSRTDEDKARTTLIEALEKAKNQSNPVLFGALPEGVSTQQLIDHLRNRTELGMQYLQIARESQDIQSGRGTSDSATTTTSGRELFADTKLGNEQGKSRLSQYFRKKS